MKKIFLVLFYPCFLNSWSQKLQNQPQIFLCGMISWAKISKKSILNKTSHREESTKVIVFSLIPKCFMSYPAKSISAVLFLYDNLWYIFKKIQSQASFGRWHLAVIFQRDLFTFYLCNYKISRHWKMLAFAPFRSLCNQSKSQPPNSIPGFLLCCGTLWYNFINTLILELLTGHEVSTDEDDSIIL